jgi:hypothetical protein
LSLKTTNEADCPSGCYRRRAPRPLLLPVHQRRRYWSPAGSHRPYLLLSSPILAYIDVLFLPRTTPRSRVRTRKFKSTSTFRSVRTSSRRSWLPSKVLSTSARTRARVGRARRRGRASLGCGRVLFPRRTSAFFFFFCLPPLTFVLCLLAAFDTPQDHDTLTRAASSSSLMKIALSPP